MGEADILEAAISDEAQSTYTKALRNVKHLLAKKAALKKKSKVPDRGVVYLGHIPHGFFENEMWSYFSQFGVVTRIRLIRSMKTGRSKGYAFIEFRFPAVAKIVAGTMNNYLMFNRLLKAKYIPPENQHPWMFSGRHIRPGNCPRVKRRKVVKAQQNRHFSKDERAKFRNRAEKHVKAISAKLRALGIEYLLDMSGDESEEESSSEETASSQDSISNKAGSNNKKDFLPVLEVDTSDDEVNFKTPPNVIKLNVKKPSSDAEYFNTYMAFKQDEVENTEEYPYSIKSDLNDPLVDSPRLTGGFRRKKYSIMNRSPAQSKQMTKPSPRLTGGFSRKKYSIMNRSPAQSKQLTKPKRPNSSEFPITPAKVSGNIIKSHPGSETLRSDKDKENTREAKERKTQSSGVMQREDSISVSKGDELESFVSLKDKGLPSSLDDDPPTSSKRKYKDIIPSDKEIQRKIALLKKQLQIDMSLVNKSSVSKKPKQKGLRNKENRKLVRYFDESNSSENEHDTKERNVQLKIKKYDDEGNAMTSGSPAAIKHKKLMSKDKKSKDQSVNLDSYIRPISVSKGDDIESSVSPKDGAIKRVPFTGLSRSLDYTPTSKRKYNDDIPSDKEKQRKIAVLKKQLQIDMSLENKSSVSKKRKQKGLRNRENRVRYFDESNSSENEHETKERNVQLKIKKYDDEGNAMTSGSPAAIKHKKLKSKDKKSKDQAVNLDSYIRLKGNDIESFVSPKDKAIKRMSFTGLSSSLDDDPPTSSKRKYKDIIPSDEQKQRRIALLKKELKIDMSLGRKPLSHKKTKRKKYLQNKVGNQKLISYSNENFEDGQLKKNREKHNEEGDDLKSKSHKNIHKLKEKNKHRKHLGQSSKDLSKKSYKLMKGKESHGNNSTVVPTKSKCTDEVMNTFPDDELSHKLEKLKQKLSIDMSFESSPESSKRKPLKKMTYKNLSRSTFKDEFHKVQREWKQEH